MRRVTQSGIYDVYLDHAPLFVNGEWVTGGVSGCLVDLMVGDVLTSPGSIYLNRLGDSVRATIRVEWTLEYHT